LPDSLDLCDIVLQVVGQQENELGFNVCCFSVTDRHTKFDIRAGLGAAHIQIPSMTIARSISLISAQRWYVAIILDGPHSADCSLAIRVLGGTGACCVGSGQLEHLCGVVVGDTQVARVFQGVTVEKTKKRQKLLEV
jgi:hypothetical protein